MSPRVICSYCLLSCVLVAGAAAATAPVITSVSPDPIDAGGQAFLLTINGTGFVSGAAAKLSDIPLSTTFVSPTQLRGEITAPLRAISGRPMLTVVNPDGSVSNGRAIHVSPVILTISPAMAPVGGAAVPATVTGVGLYRCGSSGVERRVSRRAIIPTW
jgi:hypothetical protein